MTKRMNLDLPSPTLNLKIATAQAALSVLRTMLLDAGDLAARKKDMEALIARADAALSEATMVGADLRRDLDRLGRLL